MRSFRTFKGLVRVYEIHVLFCGGLYIKITFRAENADNHLVFCDVEIWKGHIANPVGGSSLINYLDLFFG